MCRKMMEIKGSEKKSVKLCHAELKLRSILNPVIIFDFSFFYFFYVAKIFKYTFNGY